MTRKIGYVWHLRRLMAEHGMFATTDLGPLLAMRGVCLSREQVYRLVTRTPQRARPAHLSALCAILGCAPARRPVRPSPAAAVHAAAGTPWWPRSPRLTGRWLPPRSPRPSTPRPGP